MEAELEQLLNEKEGAHLQFKEAKGLFKKEDAATICCALANGGGGRLVLGISDKRPRHIVGTGAFDQPEATIRWLMDKLQIPIDFKEYWEPGFRVLVVYVSERPMGNPLLLDGVAWWYSGDRLVPMPEAVRRNIYEEGYDFSRRICPEASLEDLDDGAIEQFRRHWLDKSGVSRLNTMTKEEILRDCGAITKNGVTYAALILFGTEDALTRFLPQAEIVFEYRTTESSGPANQREEFRVGFFSCYERIWDLINLRNNTQHYQEGLFVKDISTFNHRVVREALLNAISHRRYQMAGSVFVLQYPDHLVIKSPGGFPEGVTPENILDQQEPRNRCIAEILSRSGLVERSGQGMNLIFEESIKEAKELPDFCGTDAHIVILTLHGTVLDKRMLSLLSRIGDETVSNFSTSDFLIVNALYWGRPLSKFFLPRMRRLIDVGVVEHLGRNHYVLARRLYEVVGEDGIHTRLVGLNRNENKELLLKQIRMSGDKGTAFSVLQQVLPSLSRGSIQVLLRELRAAGQIYVSGKSRGARWFAINQP